MKIVAVSDLHIGPVEGIDAFGHQAAAFIAFFDGLLRWADALVLLGDIWQTDHGARRGRVAETEALRAAMGRSAWLVERLANPRVHLVHGNHDRVAAEVLGAHTELRLGRPDHPVLFTHGDRWDAVIGRAPTLSAAGTWICGRLRAAGAAPVADALEDRDVQIKARRVHGPGGPTLCAAHAAARMAGVSTVVMGHTHINLDDTHTDEGGTTRVLNTGTCSRGRFSGVLIDEDAGVCQSLLGLQAWQEATRGAVCLG